MWSKEKVAMSEILKLYKSLPCLWNFNHTLYLNKAARTEAYGVLLEKYKSFDEDATIDDMRKKIDNMRTTYKREAKKVLAARYRDEEYKPTLWYYNLMTFLDEEQCLETSTIIETEEKRILHTDTHEDDGEVYEEYEEIEEEPPEKKPYLTSTLYLPRRFQEKKNARPSTDNMTTDEESQAFGTTVGLQLNEVDSYQRIMAEKLISDVIFYARLNKLTIDSRILIE